MYRLLMQEAPGAQDAAPTDTQTALAGEPPERAFARRMKRERTRRGWRQEDLADRLADAGVDLHPSAIAKIEREPDPQRGIEPRSIRLNEAHAIARVLRRSLEEMLTDDDLGASVAEFERLQLELTVARQKREAAAESLAVIDTEINQLQVRLEQANEAIASQRRELRAKADEGHTEVLRRIAEAQAKTAAIADFIRAAEELLIKRPRRHPEIGAAPESGGEPAYAAAVQNILTTSSYPHGIRISFAVDYRSRDKQLLIESELPQPEVIPIAAGYRYKASTARLEAVPRPDGEVSTLYQRLVSRVALRSLAEGFDATLPHLVREIVFNGYVPAKDVATGQTIRPMIVSVMAERSAFDRLVLDEPELNPTECLVRHFSGILSPNPDHLEPVQPVAAFGLSTYSFERSIDVAGRLDGRSNLLNLTPIEFEHLVRQLLESRGMEAWVTQAADSRGVDVVAVDSDPTTGGLCIVQAKRYSKMVGLEALHSLAGIMEDQHAAKGILVTTSGVGKASRDFAARNGKIEIIDGGQLKSMLRDHLGLDVEIGVE